MNWNQKRSCGFLFALLVVFTLVLATTPLGFAAANIKNVIVFVTDGTTAFDFTLARWYKGSPLTLDGILVGAVRMHSADSISSDSAPAATAYATGFKSNDKLIAVYPKVIDVPLPVAVAEEDVYKPLATVLEGAKLLGKSTGLVATSNIQHATPAAFSSHWFDRNNYAELAEQQVYQGIDVVLGGGKQYLIPTALGGKREDGANLIEELKRNGYDFVEDTTAMKNSKSAKLWGMFAPDAMAYDIDRDPAKEPSLAEMTQKALEILSQNKKGFFLFVEGSKVDWAAHANDPSGVVSDLLAFDRAVQVGLDFAKQNKDTLLIAVPDHGTGGMAIGSAETSKTYPTLKSGRIIDPLKKAKLTGEGLEKKLNADKSNIQEVMAGFYGISDLSAEELEAIKNAKPGTLNGVVGPMLSKRSGIAWTTTGHTAEDVFLFSYGPEKPSGLIDNTEVAKFIAKEMGVDLPELNAKLFVRAKDKFGALGAALTIDNSDSKNPVVVVTKGKVKAELPASTNIIIINGKTTRLKGLTIISNGTVYLPQEAVDLFAKAS